MEPTTDQLKLLSDYTLFHIGLYTTIISTLIALVHFRRPNFKKPQLFSILQFTVFCFIVAGAAGGAIASNIPNYPSFGAFDKGGLNVFGFTCLSYRAWAHVEHGAFWVGLITAAVGFFYYSEPS
jgi:hypothetical protein